MFIFFVNFILVKILKEIDGGVVVTSSLTDVYNYKYPTREIDLSCDFLSRRGGVRLALNEVVDTLTRLGFEVEILDLVQEKIKVYVKI